MNIKLIIRCILIFIAIWAPNHLLKAQSKIIKFDHLTVDDGLSGNRIFCLYRDSKDFLWMSVDDGLDRYDSYTVKKFRNDENKPGTISNNRVRCIYEDRDKNLWFGTADGLNLYDPATESFKVFKNNPSDKNSLNSNYINSIIQDKKGNLWIISEGNCLNKWVPASQSFIRYQFEYSIVDLNPSPVKMIATDSKGMLWIVYYGRGIFCFDPDSEKFIKYDDLSIDFGSDYYKSLYIDNQDKIWIASIGSGFFSFDPGTKKFEKFGSKSNGKGPNQNLIMDIIPEDNRHLLLAVDQGGINRFDKISKTFEYITYDEKNDRGLNNNGIWCFYKDREGILWVGTSGGGINYSNPGKNKFKLFRHNSSNPQSLSYNFTGCFYEDHEGMIWVGTDGGGINVYDPKTGKFKIYKHDSDDPYSVSGNVIRSIAEDKDHDMWIGTWDAGLNRYERKTGKFYRFMPDTEDSSSISDRSVYNLTIDSDNILWLSIFNAGVDLFDTKKGVIKRFRPNPADPKAISSNVIWLLIKDFENKIWICTQNGLNLYDSLTRSFSVYKFPNNDIEAFYKDKEGNLWVGSSSKGIFLCNPDGTIVKNYDINSGLPNNRIHAIVEDNNGLLWISTNNGICRFNPKTETFRNYSKDDGLQGNQFFQQSFLKTRNGEIFFGGYDGFNSFYPDSLKDNDFIPPVYITDFQIFNKPVLYGIPGSQFQTHISEAKEITLFWYQSVFSFEFAAINYTYPGKNQYAYMMEGFEKEWNYTNASRRYVTYTNLDAGEYTFRVKASNNDGVWNEKGTSIKVIILPPWWKTWWFILIVVLSFIFVLAYIFFSRVQHFKNQKILLEKLVTEKTSELQKMNSTLIKQAEELNVTNLLLEKRQEQIEGQSEELVKLNNELHDLNATKDKFFSIIAHDIKNPFNAILGFTELLEENFKEWTDEMKLEIINLVLNSSRNLYQLLENLLQWSRSQRGIIEFKPQKTDLKDLLQRVIDLMKGTAEAKNIELGFTLPENGLAVHADRQMLDTIIRNLISNALKFTNTGGKVHIYAEIMDEFVNIKVTDNGVGMRSDIKDKLFKIDSNQTTPGTANEIGSGLGLILVKEFVTRHGGEIGVDSTMGEGSTFHLTLPLAK